MKAIENNDNKAQLDTQLNSIKEDGLIISFIDTPSEAVQLAAVNQN
jgi:hypothetical protein